MAETGLIERIVERAVAARLQPLEHQLWAQHCLLTELARQLPRHAVVDAARRLNQMSMAEEPPRREALQEACIGWQVYLGQLAGFVEGDTPPPLHPGRPVPPRPPSIC